MSAAPPVAGTLTAWTAEVGAGVAVATAAAGGAVPGLTVVAAPYGFSARACGTVLVVNASGDVLPALMYPPVPGSAKDSRLVSGFPPPLTVHEARWGSRRWPPVPG